MNPVFRHSSAHALRRLLYLCALGAAPLLSGCASFQGIAPHNQQIEALQMPAGGAVGNAQDAWPQAAWWQAYGDPQLDKLMQRALSDSPTLAAAQARLERAQAAAGLASASGRPRLNAGVDLSYGRQSENYLVPKPPLGIGGEYVGQGQATLNFGYDLDLWGKNAALIRAADAQEKAARFDQAAARLALTTSLARAYLQLAAQYDLQDVIAATQTQREQIHKLIEQRVANGLDTKVEVKQAESNQAALQAEREQLATAIKVTQLQLAALAGEMPAAASAIGRPRLAPVPFSIPHALPLDLLARRPELAAQRARIEAATGEAAAAKAEFYPNINLTALIGFQAIGLGNLLESGSQMSSFGPAIHLPIFDGGRLRANYAMKTADMDAAIAQYNQSVLSAAQDVAEQLTRAADLAREERATQAALDSAEEAYRLATLRYRGGLSPYLTVLTVETQVLAQRRALADIHARRDQLHVALVRALGGGFEDSPALAAATARH